ncbi:response regulator [Croceimicrobium sp.]|uniref:response regulator n=1 Tax=Croceimicrobium sp. TaxID=2828340 RepID=UPI003BA8E0C0
MSSNSTIKIAVVDDHSLFRKGLVTLIHQVDPKFKVVMEAANGKEFLAQLAANPLPDLVVLDYDMPIMDGHETTKALKKDYPGLGILMLTIKDDENSLIRMLKAGVNGYLNKDVEPEELQAAIRSVYQNGFHYTDNLTGKLVHAIRFPDKDQGAKLSDQEMRFLELACSELTYKEIADQMCLSEKTIDGYRAKLFEKLEVRSRVGLAMFAVKNDLISL